MPMNTPVTVYFAKSGIGSRSAIQQRTPELRPLADKIVAVFGLGCIGAPTVLELARGGIGELRILDHDTVDPATGSRWPLGLSAAGLFKVVALEEFLRANYPSTKVTKFGHRLGGVRSPGSAERRDSSVVQEMFEGASLILDTAAELGIHSVLSERAQREKVPYLGVVGTQGGWGGKVFRVLPGVTEGCWLCYRYACDDGSIPEPPSDAGGTVQPLGCADPTFTGAGFDMAQVALYGVRTAVSTLCSGAKGGYPLMSWDATHLRFRDEAGQLIAPLYETHFIRRHPRCPRCKGL